MTNARDGLLGRLLVLAAAALALLALPVAAQGATVSRTGDQLRINEDTDLSSVSEVNHLTVTYSGDAFLVTDTSSNPTPIAPCAPVVGSGGRTVTCPGANISSIFVNVGDAADIVHLDSETIPAAVASSTIQGGTGVDNLFGLRAGGDTISGQADGDNLYGSGGNDTLEGGGGIDALNGDAGDDTLRGGGDEDDFDGGPGTDLADYSTSEGVAATQGVGAEINAVGVSGVGCQGLTQACEGDIIRLTVENLKGTTLRDVLIGSEEANRLEGLQGNDDLDGRGGADNLLGAQGDDRLDGGFGADTIDGAEGSDTVDYSKRAKETPTDARANVLVDLRAGTGATNGGFYDSTNATARDTITAVEHATTGGGDDTLIGTTGANNTQGANVLSGGAGNDLFRGLGGPDTFIGGPDTDTVSYEDDPNAAGDATDDEGVTAGIGGGADDGATFDGPQSGPRDTIGADVENLRGGNDGDILTGSAGPNTLDGLGGNDTLRGLIGADILRGGTGFDTVSYSDRTTRVVASLDGEANDGNPDDGEENARDLIVADVEALTGGSGNDDLTGNSGANTLNGSSGNDTLRGGLGADTFIGGDQEDTVEYHNDGHTAGVTVTIGSGSADDGSPLEADNVQGDVENVTGTAQVDSLTGNEGPNKLFGLAGTDTLSGQGGDDALDGGDGPGDVLRGDGNNDRLHGGSAGTVSDGADSIDGGTGNDTVTYATVVDPAAHPYASQERTSPVNVTLDNVANDGQAAENDAVNNVENVVGGQGDDVLVGSTGTAGAIANVLDGRAGDDRLNPGDEPAGLVRDTLIGGAGARDLADYSLRPSSDPLNITLDGERNDGEPNELDLVDITIEDVTTGAGNDEVTGNPEVVNRINTGAGNDTARTRDSNGDTIDCGPGTDLLIADRRDTFVGCEQAQLPPKPLLSVNDPTVQEGTGDGTTNATFTISMDDIVAQDVTVAYATGDGTAKAPADYEATNGTATIKAGTTSTTVTVPVVRDALDEPNETFTLTLSNPNDQADIAEGGGKGTATITDDDATPTVSVGSASVEEGDSGFTTLNVPVTLSAPSGQDVTVRFSTTGGTATENVDFTGVAADSEQGSVTILAGQTTGTAKVQVVGDTFDEPNETLTVTLSEPTNATLEADPSAVQTITDDDDPPTVSIADASVNEGDGGDAKLVFDVELSAPSNQTVTVGYATNDGSATDADDDYTPATGTVTFAPGTTTATIEVKVTGDTKPELDETLTVTLGSPQNATVADGTATGTIADDDEPALTAGSATVAEGNEGTRNATFTVSLNQASARPVTVAYETANGTAEAPSDYAATKGTLTFDPGQTEKTVTVAVAGDALDEDDETLTLELSAPEGATLADATGLGTITDDDASPALTIADSSAAEGTGDRAGEATFTVTLATASGRDVTVKYATADGTAKAEEDYKATSGTLTIPAGETTGKITVPLTGDATDESDETFTLELSEVQNATLADSDEQATGTIQDDDEPTTAAARPDVSISDVTVSEGDAGTTPAVFTVSLSVPTTVAVTMKYLTANGTATGGDYDPASGTLTFNPGERSKTLTVNVRGDKLDESNETFAMRLTDAVNGTLVKPNGGALITDDDLTRLAPRVSASTTPSRDRRLSYRYTTSGRVIHPESVRKADACAGKVQVRFKAGRKTISTRRVSLDRNCRFTRTVTFGIKSRVRPGRLKVEVRFLGNAFLLPKSAPIKYVRAG